MDAYYFIDALTGEDVLYVPRVLVARNLESRKEFRVEYEVEQLANSTLGFRLNRDTIKRGLEWDLIREVKVEDGDVDDFIELCTSGNRRKAESKAGLIFAKAYAEIEDDNAWYTPEDDEGFEDFEI